MEVEGGGHTFVVLTHVWLIIHDGHGSDGTIVTSYGSSAHRLWDFLALFYVRLVRLLSVIETVVGSVIFFSPVVLPDTFRQHLLGFVAFQDLQHFVDVTTGGCPVDPWAISCVLVDLILIEIAGAALRGRPFCSCTEQVPSYFFGREDDLRLGGRSRCRRRWI